MTIHLRTPLLVDVSVSSEEYLKGMTRPAKKNYKAAMKQNERRVFKEVEYNSAQVVWFMWIWTKQQVNGINPAWTPTFNPKYFDGLAKRGNMSFFIVSPDYDDSPIAFLMMERFNDFMYAQPVMYDKTERPEAAKFMWFNMLIWACNNPDISWVDLGGGFHGSWLDFLHNRNDPKFAYKWQFVSKEVKNDPKTQIPYYAQRCTCGWKQLVTQLEVCKGCGSSSTS